MFSSARVGTDGARHRHSIQIRHLVIQKQKMIRLAGGMRGTQCGQNSGAAGDGAILHAPTDHLLVQSAPAHLVVIDDEYPQAGELRHG